MSQLTHNITAPTGPKEGNMYRQIISSVYLVALAGALVLVTPERAEAQRAIPTHEVAPPGSVPYSTNFSITVPSGSGANGFSPDPIPANKRLVIEFVSVSAIVQPTEAPLFSLQDGINGSSHSYVLALAFTASTGIGDEYRATQLVKLYQDGNGVNGPGATCARRQNSFSPMQCDITISGYLIDK